MEAHEENSLFARGMKGGCDVEGGTSPASPIERFNRAGDQKKSISGNCRSQDSQTAGRVLAQHTSAGSDGCDEKSELQAWAAAQ
jgi:hypothetical protein